MTDPVGQENSGEQQQELPTINVNSEPENTGNPAWQPMLDKLPSEFREMVKPDLEAWDSKFQEQLGKYKPYEQFIEVDPKVLSQGQDILNLLNTNPQVVYERLGEALGVSTQQAQQIVENNGQQQNNFNVDPNTDPESEDDPYLKQIETLKQQQEAMAASWQQFVQYGAQQEQQAQYQQLVAQETSNLDQQINSLREQHGPFNEQELMRRMAAEMQMGNQSPDIVKLHNDMMTYEASIRNTPSRGQLAPRIMPTNGGTPSSGQKKVEDLDKNERMEVIGQMIGQMRNQGD